MNELVNPFGQIDHSQSFDRIGISIASSESIRSWSLNQREMVFFALKFLVQLEIMSVFVENIKG